MDLNQVTVLTVDMERAVGFYKSLGLKLIVDSFPRYVRFECPDGDSTISLHTSDNEPVNNNVVLYFECGDVDSEYRRLCDLGISFDQPPVDQEWLWREAHLFDPDGNRIILYHAGSNRKSPPWKISQ